uniref:Putative secreted protein n=1 Tax=Amblyomma tuberculatum TaxID=48802 RepID=A0A6M2E2Q3_9ACAR
MCKHTSLLIGILLVIGLYAVPTVDQLVVHTHQPLEVLHSLHTEFIGSIFITDYDCSRVHLECGYSPHVIDTFFNCLVQGKCLVGTNNKYHHLACIHYGADTNSQCFLRNLGQVISKEACICHNCVFG